MFGVYRRRLLIVLVGVSVHNDPGEQRIALPSAAGKSREGVYGIVARPIYGSLSSTWALSVLARGLSANPAVRFGSLPNDGCGSWFHAKLHVSAGRDTACARGMRLGLQ